MTNNISATILHDRVCRGERLSAEERQQLDAWYAEQDAAEEALLSRNRTANSQSPLQRQIEVLEASLVSVTQQIQTLAAENRTLRSEIVSLQRELVSRKSGQLA